MKIRKLILRDSIYLTGDELEPPLFKNKKRRTVITSIEECDKKDNALGTCLHGFSLYNADVILGFIPYEAVQGIFYEVENA